jgi:hypothetical protein
MRAARRLEQGVVGEERQDAVEVVPVEPVQDISQLAVVESLGWHDVSFHLDLNGRVTKFSLG